MQRVRVGRASPSPRRSSRGPRPALALGARAKPGQRGVDLALVVAGDQVGGLDRARGGRFRARHGSRVYSQPRPRPCVRSVAGAAVRRARRGRRTWCSSWTSWSVLVVGTVAVADPPASKPRRSSSNRSRRRRSRPLRQSRGQIAAATVARRFIALLPVACRGGQGTRRRGPHRRAGPRSAIPRLDRPAAPRDVDRHVARLVRTQGPDTVLREGGKRLRGRVAVRVVAPTEITARRGAVRSSSAPRPASSDP